METTKEDDSIKIPAIFYKIKPEDSWSVKFTGSSRMTLLLNNTPITNLHRVISVLKDLGDSFLNVDYTILNSKTLLLDDEPDSSNIIQRFDAAGYHYSIPNGMAFSFSVHTAISNLTYCSHDPKDTARNLKHAIVLTSRLINQKEETPGVWRSLYEPVILLPKFDSTTLEEYPTVDYKLVFNERESCYWIVSLDILRGNKRKKGR